MSKQDFDTSHLKGRAKRIANDIVKFITQHCGEAPDGGGCQAFYTPKEWRERGEEYGLSSLLILCHDGGDAFYLCNLDAGNYAGHDALQTMLREKHGCYMETCTGWYSAIYEV